MLQFIWKYFGAVVLIFLDWQDKSRSRSCISARSSCRHVTGLSPIRLRPQAFQARKRKDLPTRAAQRAADFSSQGHGGRKAWGVGRLRATNQMKQRSNVYTTQQATQTPMQVKSKLANETHDRIGSTSLRTGKTMSIYICIVSMHCQFARCRPLHW